MLYMHVICYISGLSKYCGPQHPWVFYKNPEASYRLTLYLSILLLCSFNIVIIYNQKHFYCYKKKNTILQSNMVYYKINPLI